VKDSFDLGGLNEKWTHPNTDVEGAKRDFDPTSVITCHFESVPED
jgi:hypothetical protein